MHYASFINLLSLQVSRGKAADYRTILRKYVVKPPLPAKRQNYRVIVFAQNHAVSVSEFVPKVFALLFRRQRGDDFIEARIAAERVPEGVQF